MNKLFISAYKHLNQTLIIISLMISFPVNGVTEDIVLGNDKAPVTIIEYGSLTCDYCIHFHREVLPAIQSRYINNDKVRFIYRDFPTGEAAIRGAVAARCAGGKYYQMLGTLYQSVGKWAQADDIDVALVELAASVGLNTEQFGACQNAPRNSEAVMEMQLRAKAQFDIIGTPTFLINGKIFRGKRDLLQLEELINNALFNFGKEIYIESDDKIEADTCGKEIYVDREHKIEGNSCVR